MQKKILFILSITIIIVIFIGIVALLRTIKLPSKEDTSVIPLPTLYQPRITTLPQQPKTLPVTPGQGINLGDQAVINSIQEINKIQPFLPYQQTHILSTGIQVDIIISSGSVQGTPWILPVSIEGIDYNIPNTSSEYIPTRNTFIEATDIVFTWLEEHGVESDKVYISWGQRAAVQERIQQWLRGE
ncbi:MAG TPA: hypothetical protein PLD54_00295 [Candidatus Levybacteria bacterium]|nr:hypothetical protein [Candidatus Levybacteria bacterium]